MSVCLLGTSEVRSNGTRLGTFQVPEKLSSSCPVDHNVVSQVPPNLEGLPYCRKWTNHRSRCVQRDKRVCFPRRGLKLSLRDFGT